MPDMETRETDKMLKDFFCEHKQEIADNGFTNRVMRKLPEKADRIWIVWVFACIGIMVTLLFGIYSGSIQNMAIYMQHISIYYFLAGILCFPLVSWICFYFLQDKDFGLI
jgi:hypothetical protein